jgi:hypothetical protein
MDFKKATDVLCEPITHEELAKALGSKLPSVRQARLNPSANAYRSPPGSWQAVVARLAEARAKRLLKLADQLRAAS